MQNINHNQHRNPIAPFEGESLQKSNEVMLKMSRAMHLLTVVRVVQKQIMPPGLSLCWLEIKK